MNILNSSSTIFGLFPVLLVVHFAEMDGHVSALTNNQWALLFHIKIVRVRIHLSTVFVSFFVEKISLGVIVPDSVAKFLGWFLNFLPTSCLFTSFVEEPIKP